MTTTIIPNIIPNIIQIIIHYTPFLALPNLFITHNIPLSLRFKYDASHTLLPHTLLNYFPSIIITGIMYQNNHPHPILIKNNSIQHLIYSYVHYDLSALSNYQNLRSLIVRNTCFLNNISVSPCPNLHTISLSGPYCYPKSYFSMSPLSQCKHLKHLTLARYDHISLLPILKLKSLTLESCNIHDFSTIKANRITLINYDITPINATSIRTKHLILTFYKGHNKQLLSIPSHIIIQTHIHPHHILDFTKNLNAGITYIHHITSYVGHVQYDIYDTQLKCSKTVCPVVHSLIPHNQYTHKT